MRPLGRKRLVEVQYYCEFLLQSSSPNGKKDHKMFVKTERNVEHHDREVVVQRTTLVVESNDCLFIDFLKLPFHLDPSGKLVFTGCKPKLLCVPKLFSE